MAKFQGKKIWENAMVYILEIISLADFRHLGLLCGGLATCDGGAAAVCGVAENLMRCLHACRSIKPHVRSCWEMNYSTFPFGDFCLCSLFFSAACSTGHGSLSLIYSCSIREPSQITFAFFGI